MKTLVILPTYNEALNITNILTAVAHINQQHQLGLSILVIDDNSPDGTAALVEEYSKKNPNVFLMRRKGKLGLGSAYREGFRYAFANGYDAIIQMDSDFSHDPKELEPLVGGLREYDVVIGSRYVPGGSTTNWNLRRRLISRFGNLYIRLMLASGINDMTGGFNAFTLDALKRIDFEQVLSNGYSYQMEIKYRSRRKGLRIKEIPINFADRQLGESKIPFSYAPIALMKAVQLRLMNLK